MKRNLNKIIMLILLAIVLIITIGGNVKATMTTIADTSRKASLTIKQFEHVNGKRINKALAGAEFTMYALPSKIESLNDAENYIKNNQVVSYSKTTDEQGVAKFTDLELGNYLVVETIVPKNVVTKTESFLIDLPMTTDTRDGLEYDVKIFPKSTSIRGSVTLTNNNQDGEHLHGTTWKLEKKNEDGIWQEYTDVGTLTTDDEGKILVENLEKGEYRFVQNSALQGYILDKSNKVSFTIDEQNTNYNLTTKNEILNIEKYVKFENGEYGKNVGAFTTDTTSWKTVADVANCISKMKDYVITENIQTGLILKQNSLKVFGETAEGVKRELEATDFAKDLQGETLKISFKTRNLSDYKKLILTYDTTFDYNNVKSGNFVSKANLEYTNNINDKGESTDAFKTEDKKANVYTGSVLILKTDMQGNPLRFAGFKIATSKENAEQGVFVKDLSDNDIKIYSEENGYVVFNGLKLGENDQKYEQTQTSYWIVEVNAPHYFENEEVKTYNLLRKPVEVKVTATSGNYSKEKTTVVVNKKGFTLPETGGVLNIIPIAVGTSLIVLAIIIRKKSKMNEEKM